MRWWYVKSLTLQAWGRWWRFHSVVLKPTGTPSTYHIPPYLRLPFLICLTVSPSTSLSPRSSSSHSRPPHLPLLPSGFSPSNNNGIFSSLQLYVGFWSYCEFLASSALWEKKPQCSLLEQFSHLFFIFIFTSCPCLGVAVLPCWLFSGYLQYINKMRDVTKRRQNGVKGLGKTGRDKQQQ